MFKFKTRIALLNSIFIMLIVVLVFIILYYSLGHNLAKMSIVEEIYPTGVYITIHELTEKSIIADNRGLNPKQLDKVNIDTIQLDKLIIKEISKKLMTVLITIFIVVMTISFILSRYLSSLTMKPLESITKAINELSSDNLELNINLNKINADDEIIKLTKSYNNVVKTLNKTFF